ncbi:hypothetical protein MEQU1_001076 [Malassezia equina]|uniref:Cyclin N-terminal domain-containing protein n=1 Tax=Malassezia equina TaxID=1381935 RepID=A0AAF0ED04_9BASI|nr:hypothetical protein MEQU1_001076 [Malassezia equina]
MASTASRPAEAFATQWLFSRDDLAQTPSVTGSFSALNAPDGRTTSAPTMSSEQERVLRGKGVHLIYKMGEFLQVGQHVMVAAATYFHRFFMRRPLQASRSSGGWSHYEMAATCMFLACKSEESLRKLSSVVDAAMASLDKSPEGQMRWGDRSFRANHSSHEYVKWRDCILLHEEALLTTLCFDLVVPQPHECLVQAMRQLDVDKPLARLAWTVLNDCMRDPTCLFFDAPVLAAGAFQKACALRHVDPALFYAARPHDAPPPRDDHDTYFDWLDVFDVDEEEAQSATDAITQDVYEFHTPLQRLSQPAKGAATRPEDRAPPAPPPLVEASDTTAPSDAAAPATTDDTSVRARSPSRESGEISS